MKENLMHIENRADVLCIQVVDTANNLQPSHHADVAFRPFQAKYINQSEGQPLCHSPEVLGFLKKVACF